MFILVVQNRKHYCAAGIEVPHCLIHEPERWELKSCMLEIKFKSELVQVALKMALQVMRGLGEMFKCLYRV
jgi:hypothetical protein